MMAAVPGAPPEETVDEEGGPDGRATLTSLPMLPATESSFAAETDVAAVPLGDDLTGWAHRLIELLCERGLLELGPGRLDELVDQLGGLLQAHGAQAQHSLEAAEWLALPLILPPRKR